MAQQVKDLALSLLWPVFNPVPRISTCVLPKLGLCPLVLNRKAEAYNLPRQNQDEIEKINEPITNIEIETVIKKHPTNKNPGPNGFKGEFYQKFGEELTPNYSTKLQRKENS